MSLEFLAASKIAELAFGAVIETGVGKLTEGAIEKVKQLRQKIGNKLRGNPNAAKAIAAVEQGSESDLEQVTEYLQAFMEQDPAFAQEVQRLAREINISNVEDNRSINQTYDRSRKTFQVRANTVKQVGDINADSIGQIGDNYY